MIYHFVSSSVRTYVFLSLMSHLAPTAIFLSLSPSFFLSFSLFLSLSLFLSFFLSLSFSLTFLHNHCAVTETNSCRSLNSRSRVRRPSVAAQIRERRFLLFLSFFLSFFLSSFLFLFSSLLFLLSLLFFSFRSPIFSVCLPLLPLFLPAGNVIFFFFLVIFAARLKKLQIRKLEKEQGCGERRGKRERRRGKERKKKEREEEN